MRFHDVEGNKQLYQLDLVLTEKEARKLVHEVQELLLDPEGEHELFLQSDDSPEELTASIVHRAQAACSR
ncbi:MAG TPA: hypothetical protein VEY91_12720 [Candidatus Limnocylindria bacterium]|nr:hypothetical protein [Candidatus Limnocylindria bacterium]